jgi:hypothetical protein
MEGTGQNHDQALDPKQATAKAALLAECDTLAAAGVTFVAVGVALVRIDILTVITGVNFARGWRNRVADTFFGVPANFISLEDRLHECVTMLTRVTVLAGRNRGNYPFRSNQHAVASRQRKSPEAYGQSPRLDTE